MRLDLVPHRLKQMILPKWLQIRLLHCFRSNERRKPQSFRERSIFVDVSQVRHRDIGTGIQRVVRGIALALSQCCVPGWVIQFISVNSDGRYYIISWPDQKTDLGNINDELLMKPLPGDVFLALDYSLDAVRKNRKYLRRLRREGVQFWFFVHDLLPIERPDWFSSNNVAKHRIWLWILAELADGIFCNSGQTELSIVENFAKNYGLVSGYRTRQLPMSSELNDGLGLPFDKIALSKRLALQSPFVMVVGTLEPRKGHADIIRAFDLLWKKGVDYRLVFIGQLGWNVRNLYRNIINHDEFDQKFFWLSDVDDSELITAYRHCDGVIVGSYAEGFGLPVIEALGYGKPVLARDLPIFRQHEGFGVRFFPQDADASDLAQSIDNWLVALRDGEINVIRPSYSWKKSAQILLSSFDEPIL